MTCGQIFPFSAILADRNSYNLITLPNPRESSKESRPDFFYLHCSADLYHHHLNALLHLICLQITQSLIAMSVVGPGLSSRAIVPLRMVASASCSNPRVSRRAQCRNLHHRHHQSRHQPGIGNEWNLIKQVTYSGKSRVCQNRPSPVMNALLTAFSVFLYIPVPLRDEGSVQGFGGQ